MDLGDPQDTETPPGKGGLSWDGLGGMPWEEKGGPGGLSWAGHGGTPQERKGGPRGGSAGQDMGGLPERGGSSFQDMGGTSQEGKEGLSWAGHGDPSKERGFPWSGHGGTPWERGNTKDPPGKGGVRFVWTWRDTPGKWGLTRKGFRVSPGNRGAQLSWPSQGGTPGMGVPQEWGFSFPGRRRTRTRVSHRGSRSS